MQTTLELGAPLETLTRSELREELGAVAETYFAQYARGVKYMRLPVTSGAVAGGAFSLDGTAAGLGPRAGYIWTIRRLAVTGLTTGTTPDLVNAYRNSPGGIPVWQFNGNNWAYTFGKTELLLLPGEVLCFANQGAIAATGNITVSGDLVEVSAEQIYKLV